VSSSRLSSHAPSKPTNARKKYSNDRGAGASCRHKYINKQKSQREFPRFDDARFNTRELTTVAICLFFDIANGAFSSSDGAAEFAAKPNTRVFRLLVSVRSETSVRHNGLSNFALAVDILLRGDNQAWFARVLFSLRATLAVTQVGGGDVLLIIVNVCATRLIVCVHLHLLLAL
jgi:hypothetical protein